MGSVVAFFVVVGFFFVCFRFLGCFLANKLPNADTNVLVVFLRFPQCSKHL